MVFLWLDSSAMMTEVVLVTLCWHVAVVYHLGLLMVGVVASRTSKCLLFNESFYGV